MTPADPPRSAGYRLQRAREGDVPMLSQVIADAFHNLDVSGWLIPDADERRRVFPGYFRIYVEHALKHGLVHTTQDRNAAALWLPVGPEGPGAPPDGYHDRLAAATGPHLPRFQTLDDAFAARHPAGVPHHHLAVIAVTPTRQREGIGTTLLGQYHRALDRDRIPAYLEASDPAKRDIYRRFGYTDHGPPITLPGGGLALYPMWRDPKQP